MTTKEINILNRIPKRYREHIVELTITKSGCFNDIGQELNNYTLTYDNGEEVTFENINYMIWALKEYTVEGYYMEHKC